MRRREFITLLGGAAVVAWWPVVVRAQQSARVPRMGFLGLGPASAWASRVEALRQGLRDLGYIEGKKIVPDHAAPFCARCRDMGAHHGGMELLGPELWELRGKNALEKTGTRLLSSAENRYHPYQVQRSSGESRFNGGHEDRD
jgi:hypothetical protein